ncbi:MAG TPA: DUF4175 family protein [Gemmatimonadaceae bacterium]|jgi:hypothetical protein
MNPFAQLRTVRAILVVGVMLRALAWGAAVGFSLVVGVALADLATPLPVSVRGALLIVAAVAAIAVAAAFAWRDRAVFSLQHVALWLEERFPSLDYVLVTAVETGKPSPMPVPPSQWTAKASRRSVRAVRVPVAVVAAVVVISLLMPTGAVARATAPHRGDVLDRPGIASPAASRLSPLVATVQPPPYSGLPSQTIDEPTDVRALAGGTVTLRGRGDGGTISARLTGDSSAHAPLVVATLGGRWSLSFHIPSHAVALELRDRSFTRVVVVESVPDDPPVVTLVAPARDSVLRVPRGHIPLRADATDDFGIGSASFEYIISSGEGETFTFRSGTLGAVKPNAKRGSLSADLSLDALSLEPGDIVHVRAVAQDENTVNGPGMGTSETRSIRIARADEYDSVAVDAAAPSDADKSMISERMLIMLTEALDKKRRTLSHDTLVKESHNIAADQQSLRRTVGALVFTRLGGDPSGEEHIGDESTRAKTMDELLARADAATNQSTDPIDFGGGESPVVAVNKPLLEAYNAMWDAATALELGETNTALPHMRVALAAIQRARQAERVYLRGAPPPVIVDVDKVRLVGKDKGASSARTGVAPLDSASRQRADRFARIVELAASAPSAAIDSILLLRIQVLGENTAFAAALHDAAVAMRAGKSTDATSALSRARRALAGAPTSRDSLSRWGLLP